MRFRIENGVLFAFSGTESVVTVPDGVTEIASWVFIQAEHTEKVILPEGVESIWENAFTGCGGLTEIILPHSLRSIGKSAFLGCKHLNRIAIPEGVTKIGENAFMLCESLTAVTVPNSVRHISAAAFVESGLTDIIIGENAGNIGICAFSHCERLRTIRMRADDPMFPRYYRGLYSMDTDMNAVWEMHHALDYSGEAKLAVKIPVLMLDYLHTHDAGITAYIREHLGDIMEDCISAGDTEMMTVFTQTDDFLNKGNIDAFIRLAQDKAQYELLMMLMNYKNANIGMDGGMKLKL